MTGIIQQKRFSVTTRGRGTYEVTREVSEWVRGMQVETGLVHIFVHHTSASLMLCENADPDVRHDLETFMAALAQDGDPRFVHQDEGPDDMPAHIRTILTGTGLTIPITEYRMGLGTWQGIYLWEHRTRGSTRYLTATVQGV